MPEGQEASGPGGVVPDSQLGMARVASFGALLHSHDEPADGQGSFQTSAEGTFHMQDPQALKMHRIAELLFYCSVGNLKSLKRMVVKENINIADPIESSDYDKRTPLHLAASDGSYAVADWLISQKAQVNAVDRFGFTPLESAVRGKHKELMKLLKTQGAKVMQRGELVELEMSALAGYVVLNAPEGDPEMDWEIPREEVKLFETLGEGAFGTVQKGKWRGTWVAVKILKKLACQQENRVALAEFKTELALIRQLHHPNVVQFLGVMQSEDGSPQLVQEFMHGGSLAEVFRRPVGLGMPVSIEMCLDCARGMTYLHCRSPQPVIHRDLKPNNLMLSIGGRLKIGDFGLSKTLSVRNRLPQDMSQAYKLTGETGSYRYMAPEVFRHEYYGTPVDVYAFSMIAYQMFHSQCPFEGMSPVDAARAAAFERRRPVIGQHMPPEISTLLRDCWHPTPSSRPIFEEVINRMEPMQAKYGKVVPAVPGEEGCACTIQ